MAKFGGQRPAKGLPTHGARHPRAHRSRVVPAVYTARIASETQLPTVLGPLVGAPCLPGAPPAGAGLTPVRRMDMQTGQAGEGGLRENGSKLRGKWRISIPPLECLSPPSQQNHLPLNFGHNFPLVPNLVGHGLGCRVVPGWKTGKSKIGGIHHHYDTVDQCCSNKTH